MFVSNLPGEASEESVRELFSDFGVVRSVKISSDVFTGRCRGFGTVVADEAAIGIATKIQVLSLVVTMRSHDHFLWRTYL